MQLSKLENITKENIVFHEPKDFQLRNSNIKYKRKKLKQNFQMVKHHH